MNSMFRGTMIVLAAVLGAGRVAGSAEPKTVPLTALDLTKMTTGWGEAQVDKNIVGKGMSIAGVKFEHGVGSHANSVLYVKLDGQAERFTAQVGVDDETAGRGTVQFRVYGDGKVLFDSGVMRGKNKAKPVDVDLRGVKQVILMATDAGDDINHDHADWAEAAFVTGGAKPEAVDPPSAPAEEKVILTPRPGLEPRINGPKVYGVRPGRPLLYRVPCTGQRPIAFSAEGLPAGLSLDGATGILSSHVPKEPGEHVVTLRASNAQGKAERTFKIVVGDAIALTPPMGWNDWYTHYDRITDALMRQAADAMVASGMADFGYAYVNIDDCWMVKPNSKDPKLGGPLRDADGTIRPNGRFPDMKALADSIHSKGLKAGLYTSPGPLTCAGFVGTYQHEEQDAKTFARWGFDFLKYDWCSYDRIAKNKSLAELKKPYQQMGDILKGLDRDLVLNLCQYGMGDVSRWGGQVGGNCWRTTGDLGLERGTALPGFYHIGLSNAKWWEHAKPGQWNDPDYILIGRVGNARRMDLPAQATKLTPNEQYSYMSMWCLMAAPLFFSGDMGLLDDFTLNILCNAEIIDVDQDPLGRQGKPIMQTSDSLVLAKPMEDGSLAVGLFNLGEAARSMSVTWEQLGLSGAQRGRDLWRQKDLGEFDKAFTADVPRHGVMVVRLWRRS